MTGWTNMSRLGCECACDPGNGISASPNEVGLLTFAPDKTRLYWSAAPQAGGIGIQLYDVLRARGTGDASVAADFTGADAIETDGADTSARDTEVPNAGEVFYYVVRAGNFCSEGSLGRGSDGTERPGP
jgi:hypothetical protein